MTKYDYPTFRIESRAFKRVAKSLIFSLVKKGRKYITLCELYTTLGVTTEGEKNGVRWARQYMMDNGVLRKVPKLKGVYEVC